MERMKKISEEREIRQLTTAVFDETATVLPVQKYTVKLDKGV